MEDFERWQVQSEARSTVRGLMAQNRGAELEDIQEIGHDLCPYEEGRDPEADVWLRAFDRELEAKFDELDGEFDDDDTDELTDEEREQFEADMAESRVDEDDEPDECPRLEPFLDIRRNR